MKHVWLMLFPALALALAACGEKPQTKTVTKRSDTPAYEGAQDPFVAPGWKVGDRTSWEEQTRTRAQGQNEYSRQIGD